MSDEKDMILPEEEWEDEEEFETITLTLEDDSELTCLIASIFSAGDREYIALVPVDENNEPLDADQLLFYRLIDDQENDPILENIEDDDELETVLDRFDELLDEMEFEESEDSEDSP